MELTQEFQTAIRDAWGDPYTISELTFKEAVRQGLIGDDSNERMEIAVRIGCSA